MDPEALASLNYPNEPIGPSIYNADSYTGNTDTPLYSKGLWCDEHGIAPHLGITQMYLANPTAGLVRGRHESLTLITVGADFDLEKIAGLQGTSFHFQQAYVPYRNHLEYSTEAGDVLAARNSPYIPRVNHLTLLTVEQKLLDGRLTLEAGNSAASYYFALPVCNIALGCARVPDASGHNSTWGLRVHYRFTDALSTQAGIWRTNDAYPFTNGWEIGPGDSGGQVSNAIFANVAYRTNYQKDTYPLSLEAVGFHNTLTSKDPYYTVAGTSRFDDPDLPLKTKKGMNGFHLNGKKTFWRADGGVVKNEPNPTALVGYMAGYGMLDEEVANGQQAQLSTGIILEAPFRSRPFDTWSVSAHWVRQTAHEQSFLRGAYASVGSTYKAPRTEHSLDLDANIVLTNGVVVSPYIKYVWNPSSLNAPYSGKQGHDGIAAGFLFHIQLETLLGLDAGLKR
ncbi:carbohydrate porin [Pseudomonas putida]|uniref:Carbohydrate porin n=1 Tax=Pseudomonas putida TaxID=303 RepID=A0A7Y8D1Z0_PSEPU|nr:carbohydrate porin [Pseudomonas putida]NWC81710.1 carbohydrate porin [Pseudomonas putida]